jgi:hypothetical protein
MLAAPRPDQVLHPEVATSSEDVGEPRLRIARVHEKVTGDDEIVVSVTWFEEIPVVDRALGDPSVRKELLDQRDFFLARRKHADLVDVRDLIFPSTQMYVESGEIFWSQASPFFMY